MTNYSAIRFAALLTLAIVSPLSSPAQDRARDEARSAPDQTAPAPSSVKVSGKTNGLTPKLIGYNLSVCKPGNNVSAWLRYDEVNSGRSGWL